MSLKINPNLTRAKLARLQKGLVGYWSFDDVYVSGGEAKDLTPYRNHGTLNGGVTTGVEGVINEAFSLDGSDDYVSLPNMGTLDQVTVTVWVKYDTSTGGDLWGLFMPEGWSAGDFHLFRDGDDTMALSVQELWTVNSYVLENDKRYHITATYDSVNGRAELFINAESEGSMSGSCSAYGADDCDIGAWNDAGTMKRFTDGKIDEVRLYKRILSQTEIKLLNQIRTRRRLKII